MIEHTYVYTERVESPARQVPEGKRLPFGWQAFAVPPTNEGKPAKMHLAKEPESAASVTGPVYLRITVALDVREEKRVEARLASSGRIIGSFRIRYAYLFQPFQLELSLEEAELARQEGIELRMTEGHEPLWVFFEQHAASPSTLFVPHLLYGYGESEQEIDKAEQFLKRFLSLDSVQEFSWMGGCVWDGLWAISKRKSIVCPAGPTPREVLERQLGLFFDESMRLVYENPRSEPVDGMINGIECTLPFAVIAKLWPDHPTLDVALSFWKEHTQEDGVIQDGDTLSAEGSYTVAYPIAVLARQRRDEKLAELARKQLLLRRDRLPIDNDLYLRYTQKNGQVTRTFRNWARAFAWYMLGLAHTLTELEGLVEQNKLVAAGQANRADQAATEMAELREEFRRIADIALKHQLPDGLWANFLDEPSVEADTSGSAGIAAALVMGVGQGWLQSEAREAAERTYDALLQRLTPDGLLPGVAQSNRGGEALQRSDYRVLSQMGMGLLAQLYAALAKS
ncbi:glycoside hydrolase family 88 protein [Paenibacillus sp. HB172176]|uniref:glycoside hydrolase family 88 protein n=1 Tax=Paenibacillus sp. HB172176 TaxID=2493690 RepID=UPI00143C3C39|nr:glycoside hydrolase family 88 protein [Paenibacillus sp. HB172176]